MKLIHWIILDVYPQCPTLHSGFPTHPKQPQKTSHLTSKSTPPPPRPPPPHLPAKKPHKPHSPQPLPLPAPFALGPQKRPSPLQLPKQHVLLSSRQLISRRSLQLRTIRGVWLELQVQHVFAEPQRLDRGAGNAELVFVVEDGGGCLAGDGEGGDCVGADFGVPGCGGEVPVVLVLGPCLGGSGVGMEVEEPEGGVPVGIPVLKGALIESEDEVITVCVVGLGGGFEGSGREGEGGAAERAGLAVVEPGAQAFVAEDVVGRTGENHCLFESTGVSGLVFERVGADWAGRVWGESVAGDSGEPTGKRCSHRGVFTYFRVSRRCSDVGQYYCSRVVVLEDRKPPRNGP
ncbi:hypothetical protein BDR22DRAFT_193666 [Usnea florida]